MRPAVPKIQGVGTRAVLQTCPTHDFYRMHGYLVLNTRQISSVLAGTSRDLLRYSSRGAWCLPDRPKWVQSGRDQILNEPTGLWRSRGNRMHSVVGRYKHFKNASIRALHSLHGHSSFRAHLSRIWEELAPTVTILVSQSSPPALPSTLFPWLLFIPMFLSFPMYLVFLEQILYFCLVYAWLG